LLLRGGKIEVEMPKEFPETEHIYVGADRLGRLIGRSGRRVRERETEGVIKRETANGGGAKARPIYNADDALPKLVAFLAARKGLPIIKQFGCRRSRWFLGFALFPGAPIGIWIT
jgi:hypothetical protein